MKKHGYNDGLNSLEGQEFIDAFLDSEKTGVQESDAVVLVLMKSDEIDTIIEEIIMGEQKKKNPTITLEDRVAYWWIKAQGEIVINLDDASDFLGRDYNVQDFLVNVSSTIGRAFIFENTFTITTALVGIETELQDVEDDVPEPT